MKQIRNKARIRREAGAALITVLILSLCTALLLGASLTVALTTTKLGWNQSYSEAALQLADAGVNSELQYIAKNVGAANATLKSSQPVATSGVTAKLPGSSTVVLGRPGTITGYSGGTFYVYSSNNASGTVAWDGVTSPFYITCSAVVNKCWQTVKVQATSASLFNVYGIFASGDTGTPTVTAGSGSHTTIGGSGGVNGPVSQGGSCGFTAPTAINCNHQNHSSGQFGSGNVSSGGNLCQVDPPMIHPKTSDVCRHAFGCNDNDSDSVAYTACRNATCTNSKVYHYKSTAGSSTINTSNCTKYGNDLGSSLNNTDFHDCNTKPGTYDSSFWWFGWHNTVAVQTLIFEPGDYYFTNMSLLYDASKEIVIDPCAYASGGTAGQVRFWCVDQNAVANGNTSDVCQLPIKNTCKSGEDPDPGQFRLYYDKDGATCEFNHPEGCKDWQGNSIDTDFDYYCGVYACSKPCGDSSSKVGCTVKFHGTELTSGCGTTTPTSHGSCHLHGSMLCDKLTFQGHNKCEYTPSKTCEKDPCSGGRAVSWSCNGSYGS